MPFLRRKAGKSLWLAIPVMGFGATLWLGAQGGLAEIKWSLIFLAFGFALRAAFARFAMLSQK